MWLTVLPNSQGVAAPAGSLAQNPTQRQPSHRQASGLPPTLLSQARRARVLCQPLPWRVCEPPGNLLSRVPPALCSGATRIVARWEITTRRRSAGRGECVPSSPAVFLGTRWGPITALALPRGVWAQSVAT